MKLAIDPGHGMSNKDDGVYDPGAVAHSNEGTFAEADINLKFGLTMSFLAKAAGHEVFMTRTSSADPAPVGERAHRAVEKHCDVFISFHLNSNVGTPGEGLEVLYCGGKDKPLAQELQRKLVRVIGFGDREIQERTNLAVLRFTGGPAVLIELGFINNERDREFLIDRDNRIKICETVLEAIAV